MREAADVADVWLAVSSSSFTALRCPVKRVLAELMGCSASFEAAPAVPDSWPDAEAIDPRRVSTSPRFILLLSEILSCSEVVVRTR